MKVISVALKTVKIYNCTVAPCLTLVIMFWLSCSCLPCFTCSAAKSHAIPQKLRPENRCQHRHLRSLSHERLLQFQALPYFQSDVLRKNGAEFQGFVMSVESTEEINQVYKAIKYECSDFDHVMMAYYISTDAHLYKEVAMMVRWEEALNWQAL